MRLETWSRAAAVLGMIGITSAFNFNTSETPSECGDYTVEWEGGQEPFSVVVVPAFGTPRNHSIPSSSISNGKGSFTTALEFPAGEKFLIYIEDTTGILGATEILTLQPSQGASCNTTDPGVQFEFQLNSALTQCQPYEFSGYTQTGAIKPITIYTIVPGGESAILTPPANRDSYSWIANVYNGTSLIFVVVDSQGRMGGASDFRTVATSNDRSCISDDSIATTAVPQTTGDSTPTSQPPESGDGGNSTPKAAIFASVFGSLIFLAVAVTLGLFYLRKRRNKKNAEGWVTGSGKSGFRRQSGRMRTEIDIPSGYHTSYPSGDGSNTAHFPASFGNYDQQDPHAPNSARSQIASEYDVMAPPIDPFITPTPTGQRHESMSSAQRKAASAGLSAYKPSRYVLHTDIDDVEPVPDASGVVELPPQYTERRAPPPLPAAAPGPSSPTWSNIPDAPRAL